MSLHKSASFSLTFNQWAEIFYSVLPNKIMLRLFAETLRLFRVAIVAQFLKLSRSSWIFGISATKFLQSQQFGSPATELSTCRRVLATNPTNMPTWLRLWIQPTEATTRTTWCSSRTIWKFWPTIIPMAITKLMHATNSSATRGEQIQNTRSNR